MPNNALTRLTERTPTVLDDFFKPWNEWLDNGGSLWNRTMFTPAVNIVELKDSYLVTVAAPGLKKDDFDIDIEGNTLTISCEKEENKEEKESNFTRKEYNYSSFSRRFTMPEDTNKEKIEAKSENGLLKVYLPYNQGTKKLSSKHISVN